VGGSILSIRNKARGLHIANPRRKIGSLLMESAQVAEVLALRISVSFTRFPHFLVSLHFHFL
jgi:plasmid maintenance system antidote protein VapI